ncbi:GPO family capsid scaffolding protein [Klebsiella pneumoniae]|uniref:GPO family capsid scaffolding protein n=1 Tax=Klebsiella pneumoniae TaxID=573 RepID=UPI0039BDCA59
MLTFSASAAHNPLANRKQNPANLFTAAEETVIELEEIQEDKPSPFARVTALFTKKEQSDDARFSDVHKAVELVCHQQQNLSARTEKTLSEQEERLSELERQPCRHNRPPLTNWWTSRAMRTAARTTASVQQAVTPPLTL